MAIIDPILELFLFYIVLVFVILRAYNSKVIVSAAQLPLRADGRTPCRIFGLRVNESVW
jgi:hypothetical protein